MLVVLRASPVLGNFKSSFPIARTEVQEDVKQED